MRANTAGYIAVHETACGLERLDWLNLERSARERFERTGA